MSQEIRLVYPDSDALARATAIELLRIARESIAARGFCTIALSGGSTPKKLYALLANDPAFRDFPWAQTHLFFGDERHVPPEHSDSNYRMTRGTLLATGLVPDANVHRVQAELPDAAEAASLYDADLHAFFKPDNLLDGFPRLDAVLLGMGPDGHTASLFPGTKALGETKRWVVSNWVEKFNTDRITFTYPVLNAARHALMLVAGADKADMLHEILVTKRGQHAYPIQAIAPVDGTQAWMLDTAAAAKLPA